MSARSPETPRPHASRFCAKEAEELSQSVLENHGGGSLVCMHESSMCGRVDSRQLASSSYAGIRDKAIDWLARVFAANNLRDEWMLGALTLLDRVAATRAAKAAPAIAPVSPHRKPTQEDYAEWLGAALCVLKLSSAEAELETLTIKELIFQLAEKRASWELIVKAEFSIYVAVDYNVAVPTSDDFAGRLALDVVALAKKEHASWPGLVTEKSVAPRPQLTMRVSRFSLLVTFLVELALSHAQDASYGRATPPIALAIVAVRLALYAFGDAPAGAGAALETVEREILGVEAADFLSSLTSVLRSLWARPPHGCGLMKKLEARDAQFVHGPLPKPLELASSCEGQAEPRLQMLQQTPSRQIASPTTAPRERNRSLLTWLLSIERSSVEKLSMLATTPSEEALVSDREWAAEQQACRVEPDRTWPTWAAVPMDEPSSAFATLRPHAASAKAVAMVRRGSKIAEPSAELLQKIGNLCAVTVGTNRTDTVACCREECNQEHFCPEWSKVKRRQLRAGHTKSLCQKCHERGYTTRDTATYTCDGQGCQFMGGINKFSRESVWKYKRHRQRGQLCCEKCSNTREKQKTNTSTQHIYIYIYLYMYMHSVDTAQLDSTR